MDEIKQATRLSQGKYPPEFDCEIVARLVAEIQRLRKDRNQRLERGKYWMARAEYAEKVLKALVEDITHKDHEPGDWSVRIVLKNARAALTLRER